MPFFRRSVCFRLARQSGTDFQSWRADNLSDFASVFKYLDNKGMVLETQFRKVLPALQTAIAVSFGGWGLWLRNSILSRPFLGSSTGWDSTAVFHVWPWPLKFAMILNMPALLASVLLAWPLDYVWPGLSKWVSDLFVLLLIPLFWYWLGSWADKCVRPENRRNGERKRWVLLLVFIAVCSAATWISGYIGGYTSHVLFGIAIWLLVAIGVKISTTSRKGKSSVA